jgi:phosphate transport system permease protein
MYLSVVLVTGSLALILITVILRGLPAMSWEMVSQPPEGGYFMGKGGGVLNAIIGSLYLATGGTLLALLIGFPIALYLETYLGDSAHGRYVRLSLDVLWGIPSIVYGAFGFTLMLAVGLRASRLPIIVSLLSAHHGARMDKVIEGCHDLGRPHWPSGSEAGRTCE